MRRSTGGFAMIMAVGMVGLVAAVLLGLTMLLATDARRTDDAETRAQLDQLLLAGAVVASRQGPQAAEVALPSALAEQGAALVITPVAGQDNRIEIRATVQGAADRQIVHLQQDENGWRIVGVER